MSSTTVETSFNRLGASVAMARPYTTAWAPDPRYSSRDPAHHPPQLHGQPPQDGRLPPPPPPSLVPGAPDNRRPSQLQAPQHMRIGPGYQGADVPASTPHVSLSPPPLGLPQSHHSPVTSAGQQRHQGLHVAQHAPPPLPSTTNETPQAFQGQRIPHPAQEHIAPGPGPRPQRQSFTYPARPSVSHTSGDRRPGSQQAQQSTSSMAPMSTSTSPAISPAENRSDPMRIADLLSGEGARSNNASTMSAVSSRRPSGLDADYRLRIRQQPVAARSCGFGERDRRVIDPPPIVQLIIESPYLTEEEIKTRLRYCHYVMSCSIYDESGTRDAAFMPEEYRQQRRLMGSLVGAPFVGKDEFGDEGCFFCFPDLSCRTPGSFRLKFSLVMIDPTRARDVRHFPVLIEAKSEVFTVYSAKDFPGMQASTKLTKRLKEQGCIISIKKGNDKSKNSRVYEDSSDGEQDEAGPSSQSKKQRRSTQR